MKRTVLGFVFLFLLAASFTAGFYSVAFATDNPCGYSGIPNETLCCWDELDRSGVWWFNEEIWPNGAYECRCDFYPGWPTIGGPCNCRMDCTSHGGGS